jgi:hypothetical protein
MTCADLFCTIVTIIDATKKAMKLSDARPQFPKDMRREPLRNSATRAAMIAQPAAAMPIAYKTKVASNAVLRSLRPSWISDGQSMSERLIWRGPISSSLFRTVLISK